MSRYFSVATDALTAVQVNALKDAIKGCGWWYWLPNYWLIVDPKDQLTTTSLRDTVRRIGTNVRCMVLEVEPLSWAALTRPDAQGRDMAEWVHKNWPSHGRGQKPIP